MRNNLVLQFCCSECGRVLNLKTPSEEKAKSENLSCLEDSPHLPTGADMLKAQPVQVEPCRHCIEKYTGPARALTAAIKGMSTL